MISIYEISILLAFVLWMELIISIHIIVRWILHWKLITIIPANGEVGVIKQVIITAFFLTIFALSIFVNKLVCSFIVTNKATISEVTMFVGSIGIILFIIECFLAIKDEKMSL